MKSIRRNVSANKIHHQPSLETKKTTKREEVSNKERRRK